jgi:hypothetical protein
MASYGPDRHRRDCSCSVSVAERRVTEVDEATAAIVREVIRLALTVRERPHVYLKVVGD